MFCKACGYQQNVADARFCNACGGALSTSAPSTIIQSVITPPAKKKSKAALYIVLGGTVFFSLFVASAVFRGAKMMPDRVPSLPAAAPIVMQEAAASLEKESPWQYDENTDSMTGKVQRVAWVTSTNTVNFDFPYQGTQHARLTLRKHPRYGNDVILSIEKGQFLAGVSGVQVLVRFDEGAAMKFWAQGAADNSTTSLFLGGYAKFVAAARKAKIVRISTAVYQEGSPVFEFNIEGLKEM